jgi:hypothetical protein
MGALPDRLAPAQPAEAVGVHGDGAPAGRTQCCHGESAAPAAAAFAQPLLVRVTPQQQQQSMQLSTTWGARRWQRSAAADISSVTDRMVSGQIFSATRCTGTESEE